MHHETEVDAQWMRKSVMGSRKINTQHAPNDTPRNRLRIVYPVCIHAQVMTSGQSYPEDLAEHILTSYVAFSDSVLPGQLSRIRSQQDDPLWSRYSRIRFLYFYSVVENCVYI